MRTYRRTEANPLFVFSVVILATLWSIEARAAVTLTVNSNADPPGYNGPNCTLRMAIAAANGTTNACGQGTGSGDVIQLGGPNATSVTLDPSNGPLYITSTMTIQGNFNRQHPNFNDVVISEAGPGTQIMDVIQPITLNLSFLRLTQGNDLSSGGGALAVDDPGATANLNTVQMDHCTAWGGGALYVVGVLNLISSSLHDNHAASGGALLVTGSGVSQVSYTTFSNNFADQNGGGSGGAVLVANNGLSVAIDHSTISGNSANLGAGIYTSGHTEVYSSTFEGNLASGNGGGLNDAQSDGLIVQNCTFSGNSATGDGGGIYYDGIQYFEVSENTLASNHASGHGGGMSAGPSNGTVVFGNNIIANNTAGQSGPDVSGDMTLYNSPTLVSNQSGITNMPSTWIVANPMLGTYGSINHGPKLYPLLPGSPAIDSGVADANIDQRGFTRPIDGLLNGGGQRWDLGSFEYDPPRETELLTVAAKSSAAHTIVIDSSYSHGEGTWLHAARASDFVTYSVPVLAAGTYAISVRAQRSKDCGQVQLAIAPTLNGSYRNQGSVQDLYSSSTNFVSPSLGTVTLPGSGTAYFRFTVTGKNRSSSGYNVRLDDITLTER